MSPPLVIRVVGDPAPKGSNRAMLIGGKARFVPGGSKPNQQKLGSWKTAVTDALHAIPTARTLNACPIAIGLVFRLPLRKRDLDKLGGPKDSAPIAVIVKPDADKLVRSTFDALTTAGAWSDDSQVAVLLTAKLYVPPGEPMGCTIVLGAIDPMLLTGIGDVIAVWQGELADAEGRLFSAKSTAEAVRRASKLRKRNPLTPVPDVDGRGL